MVLIQSGGKLKVGGIPLRVEHSRWNEGTGLVLERPITPTDIKNGWLKTHSAISDEVREAAKAALYLRGTVLMPALGLAKIHMEEGSTFTKEVKRIPSSRNNHIHTHIQDTGRQDHFAAWLCMANKRGPTLITDVEAGTEAVDTEVLKLIEKLERWQPKNDNEAAAVDATRHAIQEWMSTWSNFPAHVRISQLAQRLGRMENIMGHILGISPERNFLTSYQESSLQAVALDRRYLQRWSMGDFLVMHQEGTLHACWTPETKLHNSRGLWYYTFDS